MIVREGPFRVLALFPNAMAQLADGVLAGARAAAVGYGHVDLVDLRYSTEEPGEEDSSILPRERFDGAIVMPDGRPEFAALLGHRLGTTPVINIAEQSVSGQSAQVRLDERSVVDSAVRHLTGSGVQHLALVGTVAHDPSMRLRDAWVKRLVDTDIIPRVLELRTDLSVCSSQGEGDALSEPELRRFLSQTPRPLGILAANIGLGRVIRQACVSLGLRLPEDVAVLAVRRPESVNCDDGTISTVGHNAEDLGAEALRALWALWHGDSDRATHLVPVRGVNVAPTTSVAGPRLDPDVDRALRIIQEKACDPLQVDELVGMLSLSRKTLERRFLAALGRSPGEEIRRVRLERAKALLSTTRDPVRVIAQRVGYDSVSYFQQVFKRQTGQTPSEFRRRLR